ncbi:conserved hypothetical protein [Nitrosococcus halophilus Nc 4]|uniref:Uncharacterized protein n=1 Tax=Nitrosococcus halophilus (strain Nc4) TaxID=472759 RepID=D5BWH0_NITHN|nr:hypothetical protein [Nitrosococcus halophilus]ADE15627.1 conserved hypothetical protein [Nitrosococcus halophilus Nc 4]
MWLRWFPWKFFIGRLARAHGLIDPVQVLARLESFAQPSEVKEPLELLRAGVVFHARGLLNAATIQHNLDWIWPFWVERQFDPKDEAFIPRAFSITHINLTHRNWTAVGIPDVTELPIVDPRGLVTPFWDSWSLDSWVISEDGRWLVPSRLDTVTHYLALEEGGAVVTESTAQGLQLLSRVHVAMEEGIPTCQIHLTARADAKAWLAVSLRPYNPEGVSLLHKVHLSEDARGWELDHHRRVRFNQPMERAQFSDYRSGDVHTLLPAGAEARQVHCNVGMATAAALFTIEPEQPRELLVGVPLAEKVQQGVNPGDSGAALWRHSLQTCAKLELPERQFQFLYDAAVQTLILHSPTEVYPGPYTYRRFWFRDAAFILHALLCGGLKDRVERTLDTFPSRQTQGGFFHSQEGEWDSNGEALWIFQRFCQLTGRPPKQAWRRAILHGGRWLVRKRLSEQLEAPHAGLLPAGFSAEHLGPNDYYYWDDFWGVAGLRAAAGLLESYGDEKHAREFRLESDRFMAAIEKSLAAIKPGLSYPGMPASPYRRMDAGAIGSLAVGYPLQLCPATDPPLLATASYLIENCFVGGGFFQDMIHSGINPYLTLHIAQVLLRAGDPQALELMQAVAGLASPTGQWPEAIHPRTRGGCMGDGHHVWAAAEWVLMMRNCFVREEEDRLILASGIPMRWLEGGEPISYGPAPTPFGDITVSLRPEGENVVVHWQGQWRQEPPQIEVCLPGLAPLHPPEGKDQVTAKGVIPL